MGIGREPAALCAGVCIMYDGVDGGIDAAAAVDGATDVGLLIGNRATGPPTGAAAAPPPPPPNLPPASASLRSLALSSSVTMAWRCRSCVQRSRSSLACRWSSSVTNGSFAFSNSVSFARSFSSLQQHATPAGRRRTTTIAAPTTRRVCAVKTMQANALGKLLQQCVRLSQECPAVAVTTARRSRCCYWARLPTASGTGQNPTATVTTTCVVHRHATATATAATATTTANTKATRSATATAMSAAEALTSATSTGTNTNTHARAATATAARVSP
jgi:hypothetical protein